MALELYGAHALVIAKQQREVGYHVYIWSTGRAHATEIGGIQKTGFGRVAKLVQRGLEGSARLRLKRRPLKEL